MSMARMCAGAEVIPILLAFLAGVLWQGIGTWGGFGEGAPFVLGACTAILAAFLLMLHPAFNNVRAAENEVMERGEPI